MGSKSKSESAEEKDWRRQAGKVIRVSRTVWKFLKKKRRTDKKGIEEPITVTIQRLLGIQEKNREESGDTEKKRTKKPSKSESGEE